MRHIFGITSMFILLEGTLEVIHGNVLCLLMIVYGLLGLKVALTY